MNRYISKYSAKQIDEVIRGVLSLRPKIHITNAGSNSSIIYSCDAIEGTNTINADVTGQCTILANRYGTYTITKGQVNREIYVDEFKTYELDFSR